MAWTATDLANFMHGMTADQQYAAVQGNHAWLYGYYSPIIAAGIGLNASTSTTSNTELFKIWVPKNLDNQSIDVRVRASMQGSAAVSYTHLTLPTICSV